MTNNARTTSIEPWISVNNSIKALEFYKKAFGAVETYRLDVPDGVIAKLVIDNAGFWISEADDTAITSNSIRMILINANPEPLFEQALRAGATEIFPVGEDHGWKLGRLQDPFGHHWEIGHCV